MAGSAGPTTRPDASVGGSRAGRYTPPALQLATLIDLEVQLHRDEEALRAGRDTELVARDRALGPDIATSLGMSPADLAGRLPAERALRARVAEAWLDATRPHGGEGRPGARIAGALRLAGWIVAIVAAIVGAGAASAALAYDGKTPVNVSWFIAVLVLFQIVLLLVLLWAAWKANAGPLGWLATTLAHSRWLGGHAVLAGAVGARLSLHGALERWHVFSLAQGAAAAFNLGALTVTLALVTFTDLAFSWSSTLDLGAAEMHRLCAWIAAPWAWLWADAVPSLELVRQSQWVRMPGGFVGGGSLADAVRSSARWWSFLVVALAVWGLLPRVLAFAFGRWRVRQATRALGFDDHRCQALFQRLLPAQAAWAGPSPDEVGADERLAQAPHGEARPAAALTDAWLLCWGRLGAQREALSRTFGAAPTIAVGGADLAADDAARATLRAQKATRVVLVLTAGSQPNKEVLDLLRALRKDLGARARLEVALVEQDASGAFHAADPDDLPAWYARLAQMADPYLGLVRLEVPW